jgi:hypothetical protein
MRHDVSRLILVAVAAVGVVYSQSQPPSPTPREAQHTDENKTHPEQAKDTTDDNSTNRLITAIDKVSAEIAAGNQQESRAYGKDKAPTDWWAVASTVLMTIFTGALAWLAYLQWGAMKSQANYMRDGLIETRRAAQAAIDSAGVAKVAATHSERALLITQRSYVQITSVMIEGLKPHSRPIITCRMVNTGKTLAHVKELSIVLGVAPSLPPQPDYSNVVTPPAVLMAGETLDWAVRIDYDITPEKLSYIKSGKWELYIYGVTRYEDVFGVEHRTGFGRRYDLRQSHQHGFPVFTYCSTPGYNYAD